MSLDVYLTLAGAAVPQATTAIFIRDAGQTRAISRAEWDARFPGREPVVVRQEPTTDCVYHGNITHNLGEMAHYAGLYGVLWEPEISGITCAADLCEPLRIGLTVLRGDPAYFTRFAAPNDWGTYPQLVRFVEEYWDACARHPQATVSVWR